MLTAMPVVKKNQHRPCGRRHRRRHAGQHLRIETAAHQPMLHITRQAVIGQQGACLLGFTDVHRDHPALGQVQQLQQGSEEQGRAAILGAGLHDQGRADRRHDPLQQHQVIRQLPDRHSQPTLAIPAFIGRHLGEHPAEIGH